MTMIWIKSITFTVATVLATVLLASVISNGSSGPNRSYHAVFSDVTSLNPGDDVRMAGVKVGTVSDITVTDGDLAEVTFSVAKDAPMPRGTQLELRFRNLVGQRYVHIVPGSGKDSALPIGHTFPVSETKPALDLTLLFNGFQPLFQFLDPDDVNNLSAQIISVFQGEGATVTDLLASTGRLASTIADRDEVIGRLIDNLSSVMQTVSSRTDELDTTVTTLRRLVSGLNEDRKTIGSTVDGLGDLAVSVADLVEDTRAPLRSSVHELRRLSENLADAGPKLDSVFDTMPTKLDRIGRAASYGSWINFYVCSIDGRIPRPEGYLGDIGANPVAGRCH